MRSTFWTRNSFLLPIVLVCVSSICIGQTTAQEKNPDLHGAYRFERANWVYVHLQGTPHQIGFEHGYLLAPEISRAMSGIRLQNTHSTGRDWQFFRATAKNIYWPRIEPEYRKELQGIEDGLLAHGVRDIDLWDVVAPNDMAVNPWASFQSDDHAGKR